MKQYPELEKCIATIEKLRHPQDGCPWDLEQTHESLIKYLIEEAYEFKETVLKKDFSEMKNELGDILLQVLLHSTMAAEKKHFTLEDVASHLNQKMIRRHPHVFQRNDKNVSVDEIKNVWEKIKNEEKKTVSSPIPDKLLNAPSLLSSHLIGLASNKINFDWKSSQEVILKVEEEWNEFKEVGQKKNKIKMEEELGDFLFSVAQLARHLNMNAEDVLEKANQKFLRRFRQVEKLASQKNSDVSELSTEEMESLWKMVKKNEQY